MGFEGDEPTLRRNVIFCLVSGRIGVQVLLKNNPYPLLFLGYKLQWLLDPHDE